MMDPPTVLLERSFVAALIDPGDPSHVVAGRCYLALIDEFAAGKRLLAVTSDTRAEFADAPAGLLDPCDTLHVAGQERHAAASVQVDGPDDISQRDLALNLVLVRRHRLSAVATFDRRYDGFDVLVLPGFSN
jgi:predicted nucleic acid-binding protein